jgi:hypothetical protein
MDTIRMTASRSGPRGGTVLLLCLVILTTLMVLAFAFVRVLQLRHESNATDNRLLLARQATRMGLSHATEQIMLDYINEPFTRMDGSAHAAFVTHDRPYECYYPTDSALSGGTQVDFDDLPCENQMQVQFTQFFDWWHTFADGQITADGRGRYYEPEFYNRALTSWSATASAPTVPLRFTATMAATDPLPDRSQGLFYDEQLNALGGDPRVARANARYRLRYAASVMDLDGEIDVNGDQALDYRGFTMSDPRGVGDPRVARIVTHQHQLPAIVDGVSAYSLGGWGAGITGGVRAEHVFLGRGFASNFDQRADTNNAPVTFPLMYRQRDGYFFYKYGNADPRAPGDNTVAHDLFMNTTPGVTAASTGGDEVIPPQGYPNNLSFKHTLMGPQYSFINYDRAVDGNSGEGLYGMDGMAFTYGRFSPFGRGLVSGAAGRFSGNVDTPWQVNIMTAPAGVVYGMIASYMPPGAICANYIYYERVPNPPNPPNLDYTSWVAPSYSAGQLGARDLFVDALSPAFSRYPAPSRPAPSIVPDYHLPSQHPTDPGYRAAAVRYPGPVIFNGYDANDVFQHDSLGVYLRSNPDGKLYPVTQMPRAYKTGYPVRETHNHPSTTTGYWRYTTLTESYNGPADPGALQAPSSTQANPGPPPTIQTTLQQDDDSGLMPNGTWWKFDTERVAPHKDSVWDALGLAMGAAVGVARGQWMQYQTIVADPANYFDNGPWNVGTMGPRVQSIKDIDALFVTNLGSSFTQPNSTTPTRVWTEVDGWPAGVYRFQLQSYLPTWNLAMLRTATTTQAGSTWPLYAINDPASPGYDASKPSYTAAETSAAVELIINDMRLSFFGSSPGYGNDFRALDLNGDGKAECSGFAPNGGASAREQALHLDQYTTSVDGNGVATVPVANYFSNTGVFFVGKSRFWRVMVRGELWDNVMQNAVSGAQLDAVLCVDPVDGAQEFNALASPDPGGGQYSTHVIYQRWFFNKYRGLLPRRR